MSERDLARSANNTKPAKLPAINVPRGLDDQLRVVLEAMKERLEVREGTRGNPYERALTVRDLESFKSEAAPAVTPAAAQNTPTNSITEDRVKQLVDNALTLEVATLRASIATVERALLVINPAPVEAPVGATGAEAQAYSGGSRFTTAKLASALASGGAKILSGALAGTTVMELDPAGNYVLFKHKSANINGLGAGYAGAVRTAVGITAAGFVAGYNRQSDGAWQNSIVIDSATGNVTILGTLKAGSVIETGATVAGAPIGEIATNASTALTTANSASALANTKVGASSNYALAGVVTVRSTGGVRAGTVQWDEATGVVQSGTGVVLTQNGITGVKAGVTTFAITALGDAFFYGTLDVNSLARFSGNNSTGGAQVKIGSAVYLVQYSSFSLGASDANSSNVRAGAIGIANAAASFRNVGVIGQGTGLGKGFGVIGDGEECGGYFITSAGPIALVGVNTGGGIGVHCDGKFKFGAYTYDAPNGSIAANTPQFMCRNGTWAIPFSLSGPSTGTAAANFINTNKPGAASNSTWLTVVQDGTTYYLPAWT